MATPSRGAFRSMTPLPCNLTALRACKDFAVGRDYLVALVGPSGWGKTLLLQSVADWMSQEYSQEIRVCNALDWLKDPPRPESLVPVILDDIQEAVRRPRPRHQLKTILERRVRLKRPTLVSLTAWNGTSSLASSVPFAKEWTLGMVEEPSHSEKKVVIREMADFEKLSLSPALIALMARWVNGNGCSINGALRCLSLMKSDWTGSEDVCRACGILMPFFALHEGWDPRDEVYEAVKRVQTDLGFDKKTAKEISCYLMVGLANLGEEWVARHLRLSPSQVYSAASKVMGTPSNIPVEWVDACQAEVIRAFSRY